MTDMVYDRLRAFLDQFPLGFPQSASGVEIDILKKLFSPKEAETVLLLTPALEEAGTVAAREGREAKDLEARLEDMADKGLVFRIRRQGRSLFMAAPFMIGLYEYSVRRIDRELAALFMQYYEEAYQAEMSVSNIPGFKVIPLNEHVASDLTLLPYQNIEADVRAARVIAVTDCVCRKEAQLTGHGCDHPLETCLSFGAAAEYYIDSGLGRRIDADEAVRILKLADESGLVHAGANAKHLANICNCCPCCCASMKGIVQKDLDKRGFMNPIFEPDIDPDLCTACEVCLDRCPVNAIEVSEYAVVNRDRCLGCGLCAGTCPAEAITMILREDREEPYDRSYELFMAILEAKTARIRQEEGPAHT